MKKIILCLGMLIMGCAGGFAQSTPEEVYLKQESTRIANADATEVAISNFIAQNMSSYNLTPARLSQVSSTQSEEGVVTILTGTELQNAIDQAKRDELRKLYFQQNPSTLAYYTANTITSSINAISLNFENGTAPGCTFSKRTEWNHSECSSNVSGFNGFNLSTNANDSNASATIVTSGTDSVLQANAVPINRVSTNGGGTRALRLNRNIDDNSENETVMTLSFTATKPIFSLDYAVAFENPNHPGNQNPFVRFRITDNSTSAFVEQCIASNTNTVGLLTPANNNWRYRNWGCLDLDITQFIGKQVTLEIVIADCAQTQHDAILYIDNLREADAACTNNTTGSIKINPFNINCPTTSFNICGSFVPPSNAIGNPSLTLTLTPTTGTPIILSNATIVNNTYCFAVNPAIFGANPQMNYEIKVNASFNSNTIQFSSNNSNINGADISFNNCIQSTITLNPVNENCPLFPLDITGSYTNPSGATVSNIKLEVLDSNGNVVTPNGTLVNPTTVGNTFTFVVNQNNFGSASTGVFRFRVSATATLGTATTIVSYTSPSPNISFNNCCYTCPPPPCCENENISYQIFAPYSVNREANLRMQANNTIDSGAFASFHAGNVVLLKNGFVAKTGARVHAYIEGCTGSYTLRQANTNSGTAIDTSIKSVVPVSEVTEIQLVKNEQKNIQISPNPNNGIFKLKLNDVPEGSLQVFDFMGNSVYETKFKNQKEVEINIQNKPIGIYIARVVSGEQVVTIKIVKE